MPAQYKNLQLASYRLRPDTLAPQQMHLLTFPEAWKKPLSGLNRRGGEYNSIPIRGLNQAIAALVPDVITYAAYATVGRQQPWLYSDVPVNTQALFTIVSAWVRALALDTEQAAAVLTGLRAEDLQWQQPTLDFAALASSSAGGGDALYALLPHVLAARLSAPGVRLDHRHSPRPGRDVDFDEEASILAEVSQFRRCPSAGGGATVLSWPPHYPDSKPMSFKVEISAQTRPFDRVPLIHLSIGTRRFAHKPPKLSLRDGHNVLMQQSLPYIDGLHTSQSLCQAPIQAWRPRASEGSDPAVYGARWAAKDGLLVRIFEELNLTDRLPDPQVLQQKPTAYLTGRTSASRMDQQPDVPGGAPAGATAGTSASNYAGTAALTWRNGMGPFEHPVAPGTALGDKGPILDWVTQTLADYLVAEEALPRANDQVLPTSALKKQKYAQIQDPALLRAAIADTLNTATPAAPPTAGVPRLDVEIFYDTDAVRDAACTTLADLLGLPTGGSTTVDTPSDDPQILNTPELTLHLSVHHVGAWGGALRDDDGGLADRRNLETAIGQRVANIKACLPVAEQPTIALVEIPARDTFKGKTRVADPKFAIKAGLVAVGRLTQCVNPTPVANGGKPEKGQSQEKMLNSWYDLLRQLGVRTHHLHLTSAFTTSDDAAPSRPASSSTRSVAPPAYLAFWLIRQNHRDTFKRTRQVPVAVLIDPTGRSIFARGPQMQWLPLHQAQVAISRRFMLAHQQRDATEITRFVEETLRDVQDDFSSLLLLTCAQNLRSGWSYLNNGNLREGTVQVGATPSPVTSLPGVRHVRVRTTEQNEVPDCFGVNDSGIGHPAGLWRAHKHVFFSTAEKPHTASNAIRTSSKIVGRWVGGEFAGPNTKTPVWNAGALEIVTAALQPGDDPGQWAALVHGLRWASPHYATATTLPWPLRVAKQISEYIIPVEYDDFLDVDEANSEAAVVDLSDPSW